MRKDTRKILLGSFVTAGMIIFLILLLGFCFFYIARKKTLDTLMEVSNQGVKMIRQEVEQNQTLLRNLSILLEQDTEGDLDELRIKLVPVDKSNNFRRMGFVVEDGTSYSTDYGDIYFENRKEMERFLPGLEGRESVMDGLSDLEMGDPVTIYQVPFTAKDGRKCTLFATYSNNYYRDILSVSTFGGRGYSYIIKDNGDRVIGSDNPASLTGFENLFKAVEAETGAESENLAALKAAMEKHESGYIEISRKNGRRYVYFQPLEINDWYLLSIIPGVVIKEDVNMLLILSYAMTFVCVALLLFLVKKIRFAEKKYWEHLENTALRDPVTGLASFGRFRSDAKDILQNAKSGQYAMVCLNIQMFQYINELYGYQEGDRVLTMVSTVFHDALRDGELMARTNADRFAALLFYDGREEIRDRVKDIMEDIEAKVNRKEGTMEYEIKMAAGVYIIEDTGELVDKMVDRAKAAFTRENRGAFENCGFYDTTIRERAVRQREMENHFETAMEQEEFLVFYQPKYDVRSKCFRGAEALVRWNWQKESMVPPGEFIPLFEGNGMIVPLDEYVFSKTCRRVKRWLDEGLLAGPVSVNISRVHLYQRNFAETYIRIIEETGVPASSISLELTETALFDNVGILNETLEIFRERGVKILMDDFGSGYSSMQLLSSMPVDMLKLDKSMVDNSTENEKTRAVLKSVINLAHSLGIEVTAEGVENKEQYELLEKMGIDYIQGYYCAKPMPENDYEELMKKQETGKLNARI